MKGAMALLKSSYPIRKLITMTIEIANARIMTLIEEYLLFGSVSEREGDQNG